ncbi:MAG: hypothetical protein QM654_16255 [Dysgonamonadaceae bacterium]
MRTHENLIIRRILPSEYGLPESMMYEAIFQPDPAHPYPKEVIYHPQVQVYWDNWGAGKDDCCLVAIVDGTRVGAVWIRTFPGGEKGCGYIDEETPEIAIALFETYRNPYAAADNCVDENRRVCPNIVECKQRKSGNPALYATGIYHCRREQGRLYLTPPVARISSLPGFEITPV